MFYIINKIIRQNLRKSQDAGTRKEQEPGPLDLCRFLIYKE